MIRLLLLVLLSITPFQSLAFDEMGIDKGYYTYQGKCETTFDENGYIGKMSFLFNGRNLNSAASICRIKSINFISAGYLDVITKCVDRKSGETTNETYTMLPDQTGKNRIRLVATYVNGKLINEGNPDWFHLCKPIDNLSS